MAVLDTAAIVDLTRRPDSVRGRAVRDAMDQVLAGGEGLATTRFNLAELYTGAALSTDPATEHERIERNTGWLTILDFDERAARLYGSFTAHLRRLGRPAGDMDVLIAAVAVSNGHGLVTRNTRHFADIPGLEVRGY